MLKPKNIIIFIVAGIILVLVYIFFIKSGGEEPALVSTSPDGVISPTSTAVSEDSASSQDFLSVLLSVKSIKLDDKIFTDEAFINLHDSSITLIPDGTEGRVNPFAPIGSDTTPTSANKATTSTSSTQTSTLPPSTTTTPPATPKTN